MNRFVTLSTLFFLGLSSTSTFAATVFHIDFNDFDGVHFTARVDTGTDQLTFLTWEENPGGNTHFVPVLSGMLPWVAVDDTMAPFDVPDDWDGTIGSNWGFLAQQNRDQITWQNGPAGNPQSTPGWGIAIIPPFSANFDETQLNAIPVSASNATQSVADVVTVAAVPEPSMFAFCVVACGCWYLHRRRRSGNEA